MKKRKQWLMLVCIALAVCLVSGGMLYKYLPSLYFIIFRQMYESFSYFKKIITKSGH